jgi:hypothetical protein
MSIKMKCLIVALLPHGLQRLLLKPRRLSYNQSCDFCEHLRAYALCRLDGWVMLRENAMRSKLTLLLTATALVASVSVAAAQPMRVVRGAPAPAYYGQAAAYAYYGATPADGGIFATLDNMFSCRRTYAAAPQPIVATY